MEGVAIALESYGFAAVISFLVAGLIKLILKGVQFGSTVKR